jgi:antitoxin YefM
MTTIQVMTKYISLAEAKAKLSEVLDGVEATQEHVIVTRRGKPVALIMSPDEYEGLEETLDILSTPGALEQIRQADAEIDAGNYYTADQIREQFLTKKK